MLQLRFLEPSQHDEDSLILDSSALCGCPSKLKRISDPRHSSDTNHFVMKNQDGRRLRCRPNLYAVAAQLGFIPNALPNIIKATRANFENMHCSFVRAHFYSSNIV